MTNNNKQSLYHQLLERSKSTNSSNDVSSSSGRYGFLGGNTSRGGGRFHGTTKKVRVRGSERDSSERDVAEPVIRDGRVLRIDSTDRELAYKPPVRRQDQAVSWKPPTFWEIMSDLGLRVVETMVASVAHEIAYFFTKRRFLPKNFRGR